MRYLANFDTVTSQYPPDEDYVGPAIEDCWIVWSARNGLRLHVGHPDGDTDSYPLSAADVLDLSNGEPDISTDDDPFEDPDTLAAEWDLDPSQIHEWMGATIKVSACPVWHEQEYRECGDGFRALRFEDRDRLLHDPNFHSSMEGANRRMKEAVAGDLAGCGKRTGDRNL